MTFFDGFAIGGDDGIALILYDNSIVDLDDRLIINLSFDQPVFNLTFDILHVSESGTVDEGVQVFFDDGVGAQQTLLNNPSFFLP